MTKARTQRLGTSAVGVVLGAALLLGVNWLGYRHWARADWTKARIYSLSTTSKKILAELKTPVRVTVLMAGNSRLIQPVTELLNRYRAVSPKIEVEFVDPVRNPARAETLVRELGVRQSTVVFRSGDKKKYVEEDKLADFDYSGAQMGGAPEIKAFKGEQAFTSAILEVTENKSTKVYFTAGHGEPTLDSAERGRGYAEAKQLLERDNVAVAAWDSLGKGDVPSDASAIVVAGPRTAFLDPETSALQKYLAAGGRVLLLLDPVLPGAGAPRQDLGLGSLLQTYGLKTVDDIVIDPSMSVPLVGPETLIANHYGTHPIVRALSDQTLPVLFPLARSLAKSDAPPSASGTPAPGAPPTPAPTPSATSATMLIETTPEGWGETSLDNLDRVEKDAKDVAGPVAIAYAVGASDEKASGKSPRLVAVGNSRFATNGSIEQAGNGNFFLNSVHWLTGEEKLVGISPKTPEQASLAMTQSQVNRIGMFATIGMPLAAILLGVWVWYRRRD